MLRILSLMVVLMVGTGTFCQPASARIDSSWVAGDCLVTVDLPSKISHGRKTMVIFYALPNGNSTAQTFGKKLKPGDDWHFDIQHIGAQTAFLREKYNRRNIIVVYLENKYRSWPRWKQLHPDYTRRIPYLIDSIFSSLPGTRKELHLNGHSGGGSLIFGYLKGISSIPKYLKKITFIDSNYGYDSSYYPVLKQWLDRSASNRLLVFCYNDSIALYNGRPLVSPTGGTWYRSRLMLRHFQADARFKVTETDSMHIATSANSQVRFYMKKNVDRGIYHTQQVELNGFIHSVLVFTRYENKGYTYYSSRAYTQYFRE